MLTLKLITNDPEVAAYAVANGVSRIMVDIERMGKVERQAGRSTVISSHEIADVARVRQAVPQAEIVLRINPWHDGSRAEIQAGVAAGADLIMLPMCRREDEVAAAGEEAARLHVGLVPLIETTQAMVRLHRFVHLPGVREIYIGLNDLHLGLGLDFMFEPVASGLLDQMTAVVREAAIPFGFGGIATLGGGAVPAELVLAEHQRLGSSRVILGRTFSHGATTMSGFAERGFPAEIARLRAEESRLSRLPSSALSALHQVLQDNVQAQVLRTQAASSRC